MTADATSGDYAFLDCGGGMRLERFGPHIIARPAPVAVWPAGLGGSAWDAAGAVFRGGGGKGAWQRKGAMPETWTVDIAGLRFELRLAAGGQVGVFPEQVENWDWMAESVRAAGRPLRVLNAFAYTGAATLAAAGAGDVAVVHLDGARSAVTWARRNSALCGLETHPIRWIVDDVMTFLRREKKRGGRYDGFILDPPAFGRGAGNRTWMLERDLSGLLGLARELLSDGPAFVLLTCHDPALTPDGLAALARAGGFAGRAGTGTLALKPEGAGRELPGSHFVRWTPV